MRGGSGYVVACRDGWGLHGSCIKNKKKAIMAACFHQTNTGVWSSTGPGSPHIHPSPSFIAGWSYDQNALNSFGSARE